MRQVHLVSEDDYAAESTLRSAACCACPDVLRDEVGGVGDGGEVCVHLTDSLDACAALLRVCWLRDLTETPRLMGGVTDVP